MRPLNKVETRRGLHDLPLMYGDLHTYQCERLYNLFVKDLRVFRIVTKSELPEETLKQGRNASWLSRLTLTLTLI